MIKALSKLNPIISTDQIKRYFNFDFNKEFFKNCVKWCDDQVEKARKYYDKLKTLEKSIQLLNEKYKITQQQILQCEQDLENYLKLKPEQNLIIKECLLTLY